MSSAHALVINALNDAIRASIVKSTNDLLDAISKDYGIDLDELRAKYMIGGAEPSKKSTTTTKTEKEKTPCIATTKKNKPCRRFAVDGSCHCRLHVRFIAEQQQQPQPDVAKKSSPEKKKKKKMSFVSPDNFELRREFDAVFEEIFEEEITEDERGDRSEAEIEHSEAEIEHSEAEIEHSDPEPEPEPDFDDEATEPYDDEATEIADPEAEAEHSEAEAEPEPEEIEVKFWKDAAAKRPSMRRTLTIEKGMTFDRVLDRLAGDREAADFVDRGFAILSGENVVMDLAAQVGDDVINVLARDDSDIEWRYLDDMPDIEAFLEKALLDCEQEEI